MRVDTIRRDALSGGMRLDCINIPGENSCDGISLRHAIRCSLRMEYVLPSGERLTESTRTGADAMQ